MSDDTSNTVSRSSLGAHYETHHVRGARLGKSFEEDLRGGIFRDWIGQGRQVLDLGGRDGRLTRHFVPGNHVTIGDIDCGALQAAREAHGVQTVEVNLNETLPLPDESFDVVVMGEVLEHLPYPALTLPEVARVLRPGGLYVGSVPLAYHWKDRWDVFRGKKLKVGKDPTHLQYMRYTDLQELLRRWFVIEQIIPLRGGWKADRWPEKFARSVAFRCVKPVTAPRADQTAPS